jgi:Uma2 family endonuclease
MGRGGAGRAGQGHGSGLGSRSYTRAMAVVHAAPVADPTELGVRRRLWTRDEYYRMAEAGIIRPDERLELIDGQVLLKMTQNHPHAAAMSKVIRAALAMFGTAFWVRVQLPLAVGLYSDPEPDVAVVAGVEDDYDDHPTTALLVVEISDTTLAADRRLKASLYARAGLLDYWILNLVERQLEALRNPGQLRNGEIGYREQTILKPGQTISPLAKPDAEIAVDSLFPKKR